MCLWAYEDGSDIHVATYQQNGRIAYHVFDPGGDTWTTLDEEVAVVGDTGYAAAPTNDDEYGISLALRSDGDVFLIWCSGDSNELHYALRESGSWGAVQQPNGSAQDGSVVAIGPDSSDRITWVFRNIAAVYLESISSTNVESGNIELDSSVDSNTIQRVAPGVIDSSNKIYVPYIDVDDKISVGSWTSGASPTVNIDAVVGDNTVKGNGATVPPFIVACLAISGTDVHLLYANDADADIYHDKDVDGGGTTDDEINDAVTCERLSCKVDSAGDNILYFYKNGTTEVVYDTVGLAAFIPSLDSFRYYEDGTETGSSAIDTQDTDISRNVDSDSNLQIRIRVQEQGPGSVGGVSTDDWQLQYDKNTGGFVNVASSSSNVKAFPSASLVDAADTTNRLGAGTGSFIAGEIDEANGEVTDHQLTADNFTEYLWSVTLISADLANNDTLDFRVLLNAAAINSDIVPRITATKSITTTPYYYQQLNRLQGIH